MRWIIGDVHGMLRSLESVLSQISRLDPQPMFYFVGDYVNRGPESRGVVNLLLGLSNAKFIRGNHDDVFDQILHGVAFAENASRGDRFRALQWFLSHGLHETLRSYGISDKIIAFALQRRDHDAARMIAEFVPEDHQTFIRMLPTIIEDDDLFVAHGKWPVNETHTPAMLARGGLPPPALRHEMLWGRFSNAELIRNKAWPKPGFFGHTPVATYKGRADQFVPIIAPQTILLDTAAALAPHGRLTAMCAESAEIVQADPRGNAVVMAAS